MTQIFVSLALRSLSVNIFSIFILLSENQCSVLLALLGRRWRKSARDKDTLATGDMRPSTRQGVEIELR